MEKKGKNIKEAVSKVVEAKPASRPVAKKPAAVKKPVAEKQTAAVNKVAETKKATAAEKPVAVRKTVAKKSAATVDAKKPVAEKKPVAVKKPVAAKKPGAKKTAAKKPAPKKPAVAKPVEAAPLAAEPEKTVAEVPPVETAPVVETPVVEKAVEVVPAKAPEKLKVLITVSEVVPFMATGGMGQVVGALATTLARNERDFDIRVITPLYSQFRGQFEPQMYWLGEKRVNLAWRYDKYLGVFRLEKDGVTYYFIDNRAYFDRNTAYGHYDDGERFAFFAKAVFSTIELTGFVPDIIHTHDWQTALIPIYVRTRFAHLYSHVKMVLTLHNMEYQGKYASFTLTDVFDLWTEEEWMVTQWITSHDKCLNLMKGGIVCADRVTTVSPSYAGEIQVAGAYGIEQVIRENAYKLSGIINGIDVDEYNPLTDKVIAKNYGIDSIDGKAENKRALQAYFNLPDSPRSMLFCIVSRLVAHKGMDLIKYMIDELLRLDTQFVLLGTGDPDYEWFFGELAARYPGKVGVRIAFEPAVASMIYAGADALLMPSSTEPCGLAQMIACRYGTIPIVRKTGGLGDTIRDCRLGNGNGFVFTEYNPSTLMGTVRAAYDMYTQREEDWKNLIREAMRSDFSWDVPAKAYADLYRSLK